MKKSISILLAVMMIAMTVVTASARTFVPSIDAKDGPTVVTQTDSNGNTVGSIIYDKNGHQVAGVPTGSLIITPISGANSASNDIKKDLNKAQKEINNAKNVGDLSTEVDAYLKKHYSGMSANDLVISQLFDVRLDGENAKKVKNGYTYTVQMEVGEPFLFFLMKTDTGWTICKNYKINGNIVTFELSEPTQIALVKSNYTPSGVSGDKNSAEYSSPQTSNYTSILLISLGVLFAVCAALFIVVFARKKQSKKEN